MTQETNDSRELNHWALVCENALKNQVLKLSISVDTLYRIIGKAYEAQAAQQQSRQPVDAVYALDETDANFVEHMGRIRLDEGHYLDDKTMQMIGKKIRAALSQPALTVDDFTLLLITNAYEKGFGCGIGETDQGKDLRAMYPDGCLEQRAYIMGFEEGADKHQALQPSAARDVWQDIAVVGLPEKRIRVMLAEQDFVIGDCFYGIAGSISRKDDNWFMEQWRYTQTEDPIPSHFKPTHWQPLPPAPRTTGTHNG